MISPRQKRVYQWIREFIEDNGNSPTYEEIKEGLGLKSLNTVSYHLRRLEENGFISSPWKNRKRAIEVLGDPAALPLLGEVAAGGPVESYQVPGEVDLPSGFYGGREGHFALRVRGDSMVDEGIMDGDVIVVKKTECGENSQVVVALVDGDATVKRFRRKGRMIELHPANPAYQPIVADEERVSVLGVVVALFRKY